MTKGNYYNTFTLSDKLLSSIQFEANRRNFFDERLLLNWNYIFEDFAKKMSPCKITFFGEDKDGIIKKTLYVSTENRQFANEFIFYKQQLLDKINTYFGITKSKFIDIKIKVL